jgi:hypothetical protein
MKTIRIYKAQPITSDKDVESVTIHINAEIPHAESLEDAEDSYQSDADQLADSLFKSLPQGTADRLLIALLKRKTSLYCGTTNS